MAVQGKKRRPEIPEYESWIAIQDERGQWVPVNELTHEHILSGSDPAIRAANAHLAAAAPIMRAALGVILRKLENSDWVRQTGDHRRAQVIQFAWGAWCAATPHSAAALKTLSHRGILELKLDAEPSDTPKEAA